MSWQTIKEKYNLSISEVFVSSLSNELRLEAEFYNSKSSSNGSFSGEDIISFVQYGTSEGLNESNSGFPVLRLNEFELSFSGTPSKYSDLIDENGFEKLKLKKGDVLICRTNGNPKYVGKSAIVMEDNEYAFASYLFRVRPNDKINSATLVSYLNSKVGRKEIEKYAIVSNQANFSPAKFRQISIPEIPTKIQTEINFLFEKSWTLYLSSKKIFNESESMLLKELGFNTHRPNEDVISKRKLSQCLKEGRFDAEYWQPEYDQIEDNIKKNKQGFDSMDNLFIISDKTEKIDKDKDYLYVELADVNNATGTVDNFTLLKGSDLPSRGKMVLKRNDILLSSVEGSLEKIAILETDNKNVIGSTGFFVLGKKEYEPEVALTLLKLKPIQALLKRQAQGTILTAIPKSSISRVLLPKIRQEMQTKIKEQLVVARSQRLETKELLEKAMSVVEIFIEKGEKEATKYLN